MTDLIELGLSNRAYNALIRESFYAMPKSINTIEQLCTLTKDEIYRRENLGMTSVHEIEHRLSSIGLRLRKVKVPDYQTKWEIIISKLENIEKQLAQIPKL